MRIVTVLLLSCFAACNNQNNAGTKTTSHTDTLSNGLKVIHTNIDSVHYYKDMVDTDSLMNDYQVVYAENDTAYFLYLKHGEALHLLNTTSKYTSLHHLGNVTEDTTDYFILGHDNGNGSPYTYEYIDKKTGKNPLGLGKDFLGLANVQKTDYLLYADTTINKTTRLALFNISNQQKEYFEVQADYWKLNLDTVTPKKLKITYTLDRNGDSAKTKTYSRQPK